MNIRSFKEIVSKWEGSGEKFAFFRTWAVNSYIYYRKAKELDYSERLYYTGYADSFKESPEYNDWEKQWNWIDFQPVLELYSKMGWEADDWLQEKELSFDHEYDFIYYKVDMGEIYGRIEAIEDDTEFCYALLCLISSMDEEQKLYKEYGTRIYEGLREAGLEKCLELENGRKEKAFIAMSFDEEMGRARRRIRQAVSACGFEPMLIDIKEHNDQIVPEIYREIEDSSFVVADLTGQRGGVYYEAGYALAKGKPLILCCRASEAGQVHFDLAQINTIFWEDESDLMKRLVKRIKATLQ